MPANEVQACTMTGASLGIRAAGIRYSTPDGRVLLAKRADNAKDYPGHWAFIAGGVEGNETPLAAAVRESLEEVGHAPEVVPQFLEGDGDFVLFGCETEPFDPKLNDEHTGAVWAPLTELPAPLHPAVARQLGVATGEDSARVPDVNGWFEIQGNPISKVGVFPYMGESIRVASGFPQPEPGRVYGVYRPAEELADPACLASFRLIPWTDEHTMLGPEEVGLTPAEQKGVQGVIGENVYFDGEYLRANLKCFAERLADLIQSGKRELSIGYRCVYEYAPGVFEGQPFEYVQRRIRGNHVALVDAGRCGPDVAVLDEAGGVFTFTFDAEEATAMPGENEPKKIDVKSLSVAEFLALYNEMTPLVAAIKAASEPDGDEPKPAPAPAPVDGAASAPAPTNPDEDEPTMDARDKRIAQLETELATLRAKPDAEALLRDRSEAAKLAGALSKHIGAFDHADKSLAEVAKYGAEKLGIACDEAGTVAAVRGYLQAAEKALEAPAVTMGRGLDSAPTPAAGSAVAAYVAEKE